MEVSYFVSKIKCAIYDASINYSYKILDKSNCCAYVRKPKSYCCKLWDAKKEN